MAVTVFPGGAWPPAVRADVETLWRFHRIDDRPLPVDVAVGLGSHDPGVAVYAAELYLLGLFPIVVFTGANAPTTVERFPRGEAVHFREIALEHGVPDSAIRVETRATNTVQNINRTRALLAAESLTPTRVLIISRPYQQRRARAVAAREWPGVDIRCTGSHRDLDAYLRRIGDADRVAAMLVGDTQRLELQGRSGEIEPQHIPADVARAHRRLVDAGFTSRLISPRADAER